MRHPSGNNIFRRTQFDLVVTTFALVAATAGCTIDVTNKAPTASPGGLTVIEDIANTGTLKASDPENDSLTYTLVSNGGKGIASITSSTTGTYTYTPNLNDTGSDSFKFRVNDASNNSDTATINITITAVNDPPQAVDDKKITNERDRKSVV